MTTYTNEKDETWSRSKTLLAESSDSPRRLLEFVGLGWRRSADSAWLPGRGCALPSSCHLVVHSLNSTGIVKSFFSTAPARLQDSYKKVSLLGGLALLHWCIVSQGRPVVVIMIIIIRMTWGT